MDLSDAGAALIASFEGFRSSPYQDSVGVWTIGYGSTKGVGPNSPSVTQAEALARLRSEVQATYGAAVNGLGLQLNQNQFDALCSFTYNVGPGGVGPSTKVGQCLRAHNWRGAADALLEWDKAGGQVLAGLVRRRQAERQLFLQGISSGPVPAGAAVPFPWGQADYIGTPRTDPHCHSGHFGPPDSTQVQVWQQRMAERGWQIAADGDYGTSSESVCRQFQRQVGIAEDGLVGQATWAAAWSAPITS